MPRILIFSIRAFIPLKLEDVAKIFGPKLEPATNWTGNPRGGGKHPADRVVPAIAWNYQGSLMLTFSGVMPSPLQVNKRHTDLHTISDMGYLECYYGMDGERISFAIIYFRADNNFVPLTSTNDFSRRLIWEEAKFDALKKMGGSTHTSDRPRCGGNSTGCSAKSPVTTIPRKTPRPRRGNRLHSQSLHQRLRRKRLPRGSSVEGHPQPR